MGKFTSRLLVAAPAMALALTLMPLAACAGTAPSHAAASASQPQDAITHSTVRIDGKLIPYTAVAGFITLHNSHATPTARMFYVAYFSDHGKDQKNRPVTFLYNGGPGSSTVWLHMAAFGPRRVTVTDHEHTPPAPYRLVNNQYSLLDATDLVFVDAPSTGFSRIVPKQDGGAGTPQDFYGIDEDGNAFAKFVLDFLSKYKRWNSPKYLFGESYGTTRTVVLSRILQRKYDIDLNGIILQSAILNFSTSTDEAKFTPGIDLPYELALPTYAATAWYHHRLGGNYPHLSPLLEKVEHFAMGAYASALMAGSTLSKSERLATAQRLHQYTGLPVKYWIKANLRVRAVQFEKELLTQSDLTTGRMDTRYNGPSMDPLSEQSQYDPAGASIRSAVVSAFNHYVTTALHLHTRLHYRPTYHLATHWDWQHQPQGFGKHTRVIPNVMIDLGREMKQNPDLRVMLNAGYYDLATPFFAAVFVMHHLPIPVQLQGNISYAFYRSGHMLYLHVPSLAKEHANVAKFIDETSHTAH